VITVVMALFGLVIHYGIMRPMVGQGFFAIVLATIGIATVIRAVVQMKFGPLEKGNLTALPTGAIEVAGTSIRWVDIIVLLVVAASVGAFLAFYSLTRTGLHMRAVASNIEAAAGVGIDPDRMYALTWAMAIGIAGLGGVMLGHFTPSVNPGLAAIGLRAFPAAAIGGFTSVGGSIIGGLIVGVIEQLTGGHLGTKWREPVAFGILFLVLIFKPTGLFGQKDLERV
jgi:branched-chain amino acid transport system permease protein